MPSPMPVHLAHAPDDARPAEREGEIEHQEQQEAPHFD